MPRISFNRIKKEVKIYYRSLTSFIKSRPLTAFIIGLGLLFLVIAIGGIFGRAKPTTAVQPQSKTVNIYSIGQAPKAAFQGKIDKTGIIKIMALAPGIVQNISVKEGDKVYKGTQILSLSSNYQGGNALALMAQMAQKQYKNILDTYDTQKDLINKQKDVANKVSQNSINLQNINAVSNTESASLINDTQSYLDSLRSSLSGLQSQPTPDASASAQIQTLQGTVNQLQGGLNQLKQGQRQLAYQAEGNNPPAQLANLQKDITLQQLDLQQKALDLNKEVSKLQSQLAWVNAAAMYPVSPFAGTVQRVNVKVGQSVSPGTQLATITSSNVHTTVIVSVPVNIARKISQIESSIITIGTNTYTLAPSFISSEATDGTLYTVLYTIPDDGFLDAADREFVRVEIPFGSADTGATVPFVPIDAVYQAQDTSYLLVVDRQKASTRQVTLGSIYGSFVEVASGLKSGDQIILDRNVVAGDSVQL